MVTPLITLVAGEHSKPEQLRIHSIRKTAFSILARQLFESHNCQKHSRTRYRDPVGDGSRSQNKTHRTPVGDVPTQTSSGSNLQTTRIAIPTTAGNLRARRGRFRKNSSVYLGLRWEGVRASTVRVTQNNAENTSKRVRSIVQTLWQLNGKTPTAFASAFHAPNAPPNFYIISPKFVVVNNSIENQAYAVILHLNRNLHGHCGLRSNTMIKMNSATASKRLCEKLWISTVCS